MLDPIFWRPRARYFSRNRGNTLDLIRGRQFFAKSAHRDSLCSRFARDNFSRNQLWPTCQCGLEHMLCHGQPSSAEHWHLHCRVRLIQCQCRSRLQIANLGINNAFLMKSSPVDHAVYIRHLVQTDSSAANQERVIGRYSGVPLAVYAHQNKVTIMMQTV